MNMQVLLSLLLICIVSVYSQSSSTVDGQPYLIRQRYAANGSVELYSPYFLWNKRLRNTFTLLSEPIKIFSNQGKLDIKLYVEAAVVSNGLFSYQTRVYCYESICSSPGPTIKVKPGDLVRIELVNNLENSHGRSSLSQFSDEEFYPNRTNLFFQSFPIDPKINSPFRFTHGNGDSIFYTFRIPETATPALHWYYSHVHGVSALHVMGGLFGAFVIEPKDTSSYPSYFLTIPRQTLVLSHLFIQPNTSISLPNIPSTNRFSLQDEDFESSSLSLEYLSRAFGSKLRMEISFSRSNVRSTDVWLVNNLYQPTYITSPGAWVIFDIVIASSDRIVELELRTGLPGAVGSARVCKMRLLARNGHYFDAARSGEAVEHLVLLQGDRASLAIMCPTNGTFFLQSLAHTQESDSYFYVGDWTTKSTQVIAQIQTYGAFNDNSTAIEVSLRNLTFLATDFSSKNLLAKYNISDIQSLPQFSLSTAQSSSSYRAKQHLNTCQSFSVANNALRYPYNQGSTSVSSAYTIGGGVNCRNPCYDEVLCAALFGSDGYSVEDFTVSLNGDCSFTGIQLQNIGQNHQGCASTANITKLIEDIWTNKTSFSDSNDDADLNKVLPGTISLTTNHRLYQMHLFGHASFPYPIFMQNHDVQMISFENVDVHTSNILQRGEYSPRYQYDIGVYGYKSKDRRDSLIPLQGKTSFLVEFSDEISNTALYPILSTYLKFSDRGFLRFIHLTLTDETFEVSNTTLPTPLPTDTPVDDRHTTATYTQGVEVDSNPKPFLCDVAGNSSVYEEIIDMMTKTRIIKMNSCPNHYSVCQNGQCGGDVKTRALKWYREIRVPLYPVLAETPYDMSCSVDMVGVAANGVGIFSPAEGGNQKCLFFKNDTRSRFGRTPCVAGFRGEGLLTCGDSTLLNRRQIDKCGGYADEFYHNQYFSGLYRYTSLPTCLFHQLTTRAVGNSSNSSQISASTTPSVSLVPKKGHSVQLGWALDGFPIYGPTGIRGIVMRRCGVPSAHPQICLDNCNGYYGRLPGVDDYLYRYYMTGNHSLSDTDQLPGTNSPTCSKYITNSDGTNNERCDRLTSPCCQKTIPDGSFFPYSIGCFRGCILSPDILKDSGVYTKQDCFLTSKQATTSSFIPQLLSSASLTIYTDPESEVLYGGRHAQQQQDPSIVPFSSVSPSISQSASNESSPLEVTGSLQSTLRAERRVLYRDPFDLSIDIFATQILDRDVNTQEIRSVDTNSIVYGGLQNPQLYQPASVEYDPTDGTVNTIITETMADHFFTGMVIDHRCHMMYFTDQQRIYKQLMDPTSGQPKENVPTVVIAGIIKVDLFGYNLGHILEDIVHIRVQSTHVCTSIVHISSEHVSCLLTSSIAAANESIGANLHANDVMVRTISGVTYGISLDATSQVVAESTRPILTRIHFGRLPFVPYGLSMVIDPLGDHSTLPASLLQQTGGKTTAWSDERVNENCMSGNDVTLYWTNVAPTPLGQNVQRAFGSGAHLETIITKVPKGRGIFSMPVVLDTTDRKFSVQDQELWTVDIISSLSADGTSIIREAKVVPKYNGSCPGSGYEFLSLVHKDLPQFTPSANHLEPTYDDIMQSIDTTGVDPRVYTSSCRYRLGHVLFVADAGFGGQMMRVHVLPINTHAVFNPYVQYDASGLFKPDFDDDRDQSFWFRYSGGSNVAPTEYISTIYQQNTRIPIHWSLTTILLRSVFSIQSIEFDQLANRLYVTTKDHGLVLSMDMPVLMQAQENMTSESSLSMSSTTNFVSSWPISLDIRSWQLACVTPQFQANPLRWPVSWLRIIHCGNLVTRAHGLMVLPLPVGSISNSLAQPNNGSSIDIQIPWILKQRMVLVDTNQQQLIIIREDSMIPVRSTDLGRNFQVYFPHQIRWLSSSQVMMNNTITGNEEEVIVHRVLISEYLGKMWTMNIESRNQNSILAASDVVLKPTLVMDWSAYTASIKVRELLTTIREEGNMIYEGLFFEASP